MANPESGIDGSGFPPSLSSQPPLSDVVSVCGRRIEFQLEIKPYNPVPQTTYFKLETLNPHRPGSADPRLAASSSSPTAKKPDGLDLFENGLDPLLTSRVTFRRIGAGLANLGNTCFLNSVLQCLTYTEPLAAYLQTGKHNNSCRMIGFCALCAIQRHVRNALQATGRILAPKDLVSNLRCISRNFRNARQEDAHEYMIHLLESMHKCCLPSGVPTESSTAYEKSLVHKIFGGRLRSRVKCLQCSNCSDKFDPFLDLSLEILKAESLHKALLHFTAAEKLDDGEKHYLCEKCKQKVKALKQMTVDKAPYVLTIHLKRFGSHFSGQKIDKKVHFGPALDLKPFVSSSYADGDLRYTLYGVLVHAGGSTHSGHYYCFVRTSSGMWYSLDDNKVVQVSERIVLDQKAYMLFYVRDRKNLAPTKLINVAQKADVVTTPLRNLSAAESHSRELHNSSAENISNGLISKNSTSVGVLVQKNVTDVCSTLSSAKDESVQKSNPAILSEHTVMTNEKTLVSKSGVEYIVQTTERIKNNYGTLDLSKVPATNVNACSDYKNSNGNADSVVKPSGFGSLNIVDSANCINPQKMDSDSQLESCIVPNHTHFDVLVEKIDSDHQSSVSLVDGKFQVDGLKLVPSVPVESIKIPDLVGNVSAASSSHILGKKLKKQNKIRSPAMLIGPNMLYKVAYSIRKRKKGKKKKVSVQNLVVERLVGNGCIAAESRPSTSEGINCISTDRSGHYFSQLDTASRKDKKGSAKKIVMNGGESLVRENFDERLKDRIDQSSAVLGTDLKSLNRMSLEIDTNHLGNMKPASLKDSLDFQVRNGKEFSVALDLQTAAVGRWDGVESASSKNLVSNGSRTISIGYVADEWDEEYDRGRRKKLKRSRISFSEPNPFQEIATKKAKLKMEKGLN